MADVPLPPPPSQPPTWGPPPEGPPVRPAPRPRKPRRVFFWFFLALQLFFLVWIVAALNTDPDADACAELTGDALRLCRNTEEVATAAGVWLVVVFWAAVDVVLATTYGIYRLGRRQRS
ncbi:hypothetical protein [Streptomyces sp. gCLA4]|uniref:hypothetical protein n=1 Tax=Streptomyces sp. gCLA4 TaxID=1873416 RepID=UPI001603E643|nr:hypothetical protein [Streptomyces sp. gCLA4]